MISDYNESLPLNQEQQERMGDVLEENLIGIGVENALVIDTAGNIIVNNSNGNCEHDLSSLATLASSNYAAMNAMAKIIGEEEFPLHFYKGKNENTHFSKINNQFLLITLFSVEVSLGLLSMKIAESAEKIRCIIREWKKGTLNRPQPAQAV